MRNNKVIKIISIGVAVAVVVTTCDFALAQGPRGQCGALRAVRAGERGRGGGIQKWPEDIEELKRTLKVSVYEVAVEAGFEGVMVELCGSIIHLPHIKGSRPDDLGDVDIHVFAQRDPTKPVTHEEFCKKVINKIRERSFVVENNPDPESNNVAMISIGGVCVPITIQFFKAYVSNGFASLWSEFFGDKGILDVEAMRRSGAYDYLSENLEIAVNIANGENKSDEPHKAFKRQACVAIILGEYDLAEKALSLYQAFRDGTYEEREGLSTVAYAINAEIYSRWNRPNYVPPNLPKVEIYEVTGSFSETTPAAQPRAVADSGA